MSTATADQIPESLVSQPDGRVLFMSRRRELRLTKIGRYPVMGQIGQKVGETHGQVVPFRDGTFWCPQDGTVALEDGREADAVEVLAWLESHRLNGDVNDGFWRVDPTAPAPSREELEALMNAAIELDVDRLEAIVAQERGGWQRDDILVTAENALDRVRQTLAQAQADAQQAAQQTAADPEVEGGPPAQE